MSADVRDALAFGIYFVMLLFGVFGVCVFVRSMVIRRRARRQRWKPYTDERRRVEEDVEL